MLDFVGWLRDWNLLHARGDERSMVSVVGLDLYSLFTSAAEVIKYLKARDPPAAKAVAERYACFGAYGGDPQAYGYSVAFGAARSCEREAAQVLAALHNRRMELMTQGTAALPPPPPSGADSWSAPSSSAAPSSAGAGAGSGNGAAGVSMRTSSSGTTAGAHPPPPLRVSRDLDETFHAELHARTIANAERYYTAMFGGHAESWNVRDAHMASTLQQLLAFHAKRGRPGKAVVFAHNSHLGDARATDVTLRGELNVGQILREQLGDACFNVGFSTYTGTVSAASHWDGPVERKRVRPAMPGSYERLFHDTGLPKFVLHFRGPRASKELADALAQERLERAIGVIYRPRSERTSHMFHACLPRQFDALIHVDETRAVEPLEDTPLWRGGEEETFPSGL